MNKEEVIKDKFFYTLKCGRGRAYLLAQEYPSIDFSDYIIEGALHNYAYDGQSENERANSNSWTFCYNNDYCNEENKYG